MASFTSSLMAGLRRASQMYFLITLIAVVILVVVTFYDIEVLQTLRLSPKTPLASISMMQEQDGVGFEEATTVAIEDGQTTVPPPGFKYRKNVLFIVSDDLRPQLNSYKGNNHPNPFSDFQMHTPNLDALAARSLQLNQAHVQFAVCGPSRASYMTSRRPDTTKVWDLTSFWRDAGGNFTTIPQFFKDNGYKTQGLGKIYHPGVGSNDPLSWSEPYYFDEYGLFYQEINTSWWAVPAELSKEKPLHDEDITDKAVQFMEGWAEKAKTGDEPFFLAVGFQKPHIPFVFPERYAEHYPVDQMELATNPYAPKNFPKIAWFHIEGSQYDDIKKYNCKGHFNQTLPDEAAVLVRRAYFSCVSFVDDMIGRLVSAVRRLGLDKSTIISFIGDHGFHLGENAMWGKHTNLQQSTHAPMMLHIPGKTDSGIMSDSIVEFVDFFPTLTEAAGLASIPPCPKDSSDVQLCTEGVSLLPLLKDPSRKIKNYAISQMPRHKSIGYTIRSDRYRYVEWPKVNKIHVLSPDDMSRCRFDILWDQLLGRELYDQERDPEENNNIIDDPDYSKTAKKLSRVLHRAVNDTIWTNCYLSA